MPLFSAAVQGDFSCATTQLGAVLEVGSRPGASLVFSFAIRVGTVGDREFARQQRPPLLKTQVPSRAQFGIAISQVMFGVHPKTETVRLGTNFIEWKESLDEQAESGIHTRVSRS